MKKILFAGVLFLLAAEIGCVSSKNLTEPEMVTLEEQNPYDAGTLKAVDTAYNWQQANIDALAKATSAEALAPFVASDAAAAELLARVRAAYATDPVDMVRIAAVTQGTMNPKSPLAARRARWTAALVKAARFAPDAYRKMFYLDQLRWCGATSDAASVREIGSKSKDKAVRDFAAQVARELK